MISQYFKAYLHTLYILFVLCPIEGTLLPHHIMASSNIESTTSDTQKSGPPPREEKDHLTDPYQGVANPQVGWAYNHKTSADLRIILVVVDNLYCYV